MDFPGAGVFQYISFRSAASMVTSLLIMLLLGKPFIRWMQNKLGMMDEVRTELGLEGAERKAKTPTMGGLLILAAIIIPTLLFAKLDNMLEVTAKQLDDRYQFQKTAYAKQFPLLMKSLWIGADKLGPTDTIESVINQGTLGIGFIGLAEALVALIGKHHGESEEAQELGLKIVDYMRERVNDFCERYHHNYSVLATPAEGLSGKFTKKDRKEFGVIPGVTDRDYYTNSNHVPVYYKCSARHKAEVEAPYHEMTRGGHIFYVEIDGDATHNPQVIMSVVDMMDQLNMGYGSVNHNRNRCMDCGYENAADHLEKCPKCGSTNIDRLQRITGYLVGTTDRWNSGKLAELNDRVTHIDHGAKDLFE